VSRSEGVLSRNQPGGAAQAATTGSRWIRALPGLNNLVGYEPKWLANDLTAGLVLTTMLVPVGIAYAEASGVPGINGLYATMVPLLVYAVFGPSRIFVLGPDSGLAAVILAVVAPLSGGDPRRAVTVGGMLALVAGAVCLGVGLMRLGFITELLSKPIRYGYMNGIALTVLVSQLPKMFGISVERAGPVRDIIAGNANWTAFAVGAGTMAIIVALKPFRRIPGVLIAVAAATVTVGLFSLETTAGLKVLGHLSGGLPPFAMPWPGGDHLGTIFVGGCTVALVAVADTSVLSRTFAAKTTTTVDPNTEIIALGAANVGAALFQGFPISSSSSRTPVAADAGAKTQLAGVVGAAMIAVLLMFAPGLMRHLPTAALAAVVITSAIGLIEIAGLRRIFRVQRSEFWLSVACFVGVAVLGAIPGIGLAIVIAVGQFLWDAWRPHYAVMGRVDGVRGYHDLKRYPDARLVPGLVLFRWDAPLFFANAELFQQRILEAVAASPTPVRRVIVAAEPVTDVDVTAGDMLTELHRKLRDAGIELRFAEMKDPVKDQLKRLELLQHLGSDVFHPTVGAAIDSYLAEHHVAWEP